MWYAILCDDIEDSLSLRLQHRAAHRTRLEMLDTKGRLLIAGPHPLDESQNDGGTGFSGSLIIAEFDTIQAAQEWADQDPFLLNGIYKRVTVKPFHRVLPVG